MDRDRSASSPKTKIGIMGGTFNPIHYGHLVTAEEALYQFQLDTVIFMPTGRPPHKSRKDLASAEDRYLMTVIATASNSRFTVSRMEVDRKSTTYSIDTLKELRRIYGEEVDLFFITGADAIFDILTWKDPETAVKLCKFIAATRPGYDLKKIESLREMLMGKKEVDPKNNIIYDMEIPALAISSTDIRRRVREGRAITYLLPDGVMNYIYKMGLYKNSS
ncbi:nicotinate-nucleotide adenylyltransferase [Candidatus Hakubella thermalkaliphila]|uniref:Probable nicotinate-nucleotide adenylyltransferase n=2 Tax=Candidatus Hakubella thermalkaliphila TaxID=2754717 RepID=A0A6V8Q3F0_9ACTN|nr:nicotinate-nucleotide adenylyltransferase [Candidatus Hakubella thermalkaliphila]GFP29306.1 nicotinate-nucleotide adenylyltransferase [Candidatus Hakubella thermalkaliphila]GFP38960.1 nicotinate-nucleotide adenylyltransferase [Candidatus Hakubella thermalkaliphila]